MMTTETLRGLDDEGLLRSLKAVCAREREVMAELLAHLAEVEARKLHLARACSTLFIYCREVLHFSEHQAYERAYASRAARRFPVILELLREGALHLSGLTLLIPHLDDSNHVELLERARFQSKREIEKMLAASRPQPSASDAVRRLPDRKQEIKPLGPARVAPAPTAQQQILGSTPVAASPEKQERPRVEERFAVTFTATERVHQKLERARALVRHRLPAADLNGVFELALDALLEKLEKQREGATTKPRVAKPCAPNQRHVPRAVRRAVYERDGHRCTFESLGRRCTEQGFLELHHLHAFARSGETTVENLAVRCRMHNAYEGELVFGPRAGPRTAEPPG